MEKHIKKSKKEWKWDNSLKNKYKKGKELYNGEYKKGFRYSKRKQKFLQSLD